MLGRRDDSGHEFDQAIDAHGFAFAADHVVWFPIALLLLMSALGFFPFRDGMKPWVIVSFLFLTTLTCLIGLGFTAFWLINDVPARSYTSFGPGYAPSLIALPILAVVSAATGFISVRSIRSSQRIARATSRSTFPTNATD
jgi:hypothetical protein